MIRGVSRRGQPLAVLALLLGSWVSARAMMWDASAMPMVARPVSVQVLEGPQAGGAVPGPVPLTASPQPGPLEQAKAAAVALASDALPRAKAGLATAARKVSGKFGYAMAGDQAGSAAIGFPAPAPAYAPAPRAAPRMAQAAPSRAGARTAARAPDPIYVQQPYGGASWSQAPATQSDPRFAPASYSGFSPVFFPTAPDAGAPAGGGAPPARPRARRWSMDAWYYWRRGGTAGLSQGAFAPSYGASQAGGVLRYRLAPSSGHKPSLYVRTTAALNGSYEREAALGLSARPFAKVPIVLAAEGRYTTTPDGRELRPAGFAYTELPPFRLPLGLRGELYAQGGYVGGANATPFIDGQLRIDHKLLKLNKPEVRLGGGLWGGAQKGAARLDAGPSIIVSAPIRGSLSARLAADWRFRLNGDAAPDSGPAVTLSAGF